MGDSINPIVNTWAIRPVVKEAKLGYKNVFYDGWRSVKKSL